MGSHISIYNGDFMGKQEKLEKLKIWFKENSDMEVFRKYADYLERHIKYVVEEGIALGLPEEHMLKHDASKYEDVEFKPYSHYYYTDGDEWDTEFNYAWHNHLINNPHHWGHWILYPHDKKSDSDKGHIVGKAKVLEMPELYATEMFADWLGAGKAIHGKSDISEWLSGSYGSILLHPNTERHMKKLLWQKGYDINISFGKDFDE